MLRDTRKATIHEVTKCRGRFEAGTAEIKVYRAAAAPTCSQFPPYCEVTDTPRPFYVNPPLSRPSRHITGSGGIAPLILKFDIIWWLAVNVTPWSPDSSETSCRHPLNRKLGGDQGCVLEYT